MLNPHPTLSHKMVLHIWSPWLESFIPLMWLAPSLYFFHVAASRPQHTWFALPALLVATNCSLRSASQLPPILGRIWGVVSCMFMAHCFSILLLERPKIPSSEKSLDKRAIVPFHQWNNPRRLKTTHDTAEPVEAQKHLSRTKFAVMRIAKLLWYRLLWWLLSTYVFPGPFTFTPNDFDPLRTRFFRRLPEVTLREFQIRSALGLFASISPYILIDSGHAACSLVFVNLLRLDMPEDWPPIFGSCTDAYSMRRYWGKFWHNLSVRPFKVSGQWVTRNLLRCTPGTQVDKIMTVFMIFLISGLIHSFVEYQMDDGYLWYSDTCWYVLNFVAGAVEVGMNLLVEFILGRRFGNESYPLRLAYKLLGFVWVFAFFSWSVPKCNYAKLYHYMTDSVNEQ